MMLFFRVENICMHSYVLHDYNTLLFFYLNETLYFSIEKKIRIRRCLLKEVQNRKPRGKWQGNKVCIETDEKIEKWASYKRNYGTWIFK